MPTTPDGHHPGQSAGQSAAHGVAPTPVATPTPGPYGQQPQTAPGLAAYRIDASPLPLPPASNRGQGGFTPSPGGFAPPAPMGVPMGAPMAAPYAARPLAAPPASRGGIVFIIIGLSAVIAVLILVVVWALWLRS